MRQKIQELLNVCVHLGYKRVVLGSWGCGAFKCPPNKISQMFKEMIPLYPFDHVYFAIIDYSRSNNYSIFSNIFH